MKALSRIIFTYLIIIGLVIQLKVILIIFKFIIVEILKKNSANIAVLVIVYFQ